MCDSNAGLITDISTDNCQPCDPGYYSPVGSNQCIACAINTVQPRRQSGECITCGTNVFGRDEARTVCECDIGYYLDDYASSYPNTQTCVECMDGADCSSTGTRLSLLGAENGYWRDNISRIDFEKCYFAHRCEGGYYSECANDGETGYTCMQCNTTNYEYIRSANQCWKCPPSTAESAAWIMFTIMFGLVIFGVLLCMVNRVASKQFNNVRERNSVQTVKEFKEHDHEMRKERKITTNGVSPYEASSMTKMKLLILDFQCIAKLTIQWAREWSPAFTRFGHWLDLFNFNVIQTAGVGCVSSIGYYTELLLTLLLPLIAFALILLFYVIPELYCTEWKPSSSERKITKYKTTRMIIFCVYLLYIPTTTVLFTIYSCVELDDGYFLYFALDTKCYTDEWIAWNYVCGAFGGLFIFGVPLFFQLLVWSHRHRLSEPECLVKYDIIYGAYEHSMLYVDAIELISRWMLISFVALLPAAIQPYVGLIIVGLMILFILIKMPYCSPVIDRLHLLSYINLSVILLATIVYQENEDADDWRVTLMDVALICSVCIIFFTTWAHELTGKTVTGFLSHLYDEITRNKSAVKLMPQDELMKWGQMKKDVHGMDEWKRILRRDLDDEEKVRALKKAGDEDDNVEQWTMNPLYIEPEEPLIPNASR